MEYEDSVVSCDGKGLTLKKYYFPVGLPKRVAWEDVRRVEAKPLSWLTGKGRIWGMGVVPAWFNYDSDRASKTRVYFLDVGSFIKIAVTPDRPELFEIVLKRHTQEIPL